MMSKKTNSPNINSGTPTRTFLTPPHWGPNLRYLGLILVILGIIFFFEVTYFSFESYYSKYPFDIPSLLYNMLTAWPLILIYLGYFGFIGKWGYVNRIVLEQDKTVFYLLGFFGRESEKVIMDSVTRVQSNKIVGEQGNDTIELYIKRRYVTKDIEESLMNM